MPIIPTGVEYVFQQSAFDSPIAKARLHLALEKLERREMKKRWSDTEHYNWNFTPYYAPMKYCILNVVKDNDYHHKRKSHRHIQ
jgi:hypothetical protein